MKHNIDLVVALEQLSTTVIQVPFTFKAQNLLGFSVDVFARMENKTDWYSNQSFIIMIDGDAKIGVLAAGAERYFLVDWVARTTIPATDTEEDLELRLQYYGDPGGVPSPRVINEENIWVNVTFIDFSSGTYVVVDEDTFEADL